MTTLNKQQSLAASRRKDECEMTDEEKYQGYQDWKFRHLLCRPDTTGHEEDPKYPEYEEWLASPESEKYLAQEKEAARRQLEYQAWRVRYQPVTIGEFLEMMHSWQSPDVEDEMWRVMPELLMEMGYFFYDNPPEDVARWAECCLQSLSLAKDIVRGSGINDTAAILMGDNPQAIEQRLAERANQIVNRMATIATAMLQLEGVSPAARERLEQITKLGREEDKISEAAE
jgi:hypothetical protein